MPEDPPHPSEPPANRQTGISGDADTLDAAPRIVDRVIGRYRLIAEIGRGGMGVVWRARDLELERDVAIKLLNRAAAGSSASGESRSRLLREAKSLAQLAHPNVVSVYDVGTTDDGDVWVAMEYVVGVNGDTWHARSKPSWRETLAVYEQVGRGLAAAHAADIVHRDFKPANFIIGSDGRARVLDFGLARKNSTPELVRRGGELAASSLPETMTLEGAVLGTPLYMSPEQMNGQLASPASDQFSFAVSLWQAIFGAHPYPATNFAHLGARLMDGDIEDPPTNDVPARIEATLRKALSTEPGDRFESIDALLAELSPPVRHSWLIPTGVGIVALAVAAGVVLHLSRDTSGQCPLDDSGWTTAVTDETKAKLKERYPKRADALIASLETQRSEWMLSRQRVCLESARGYQTDAEFAAKMACLSERRIMLAQLPSIVVRLETDATKGDGIERAQDLLAGSRIHSQERSHGSANCENLAGSAAQFVDSPEANEVRGVIAAAKLRLKLGLHAEAKKVIDPVVDRSVNLGAKALTAAALSIRGESLRRELQFEDAERDLRDAIAIVSESGDSASEASLWVVLTELVADQGRTDEARGLATAAEAAIKRADVPAERGRFEGVLAKLAQREGKLAEAIERYEVARSSLATAFGESSVEVAEIDESLGQLALASSKIPEAAALFERAVAAHEKMRGATHPATFRARVGLATALSISGKQERASIEFREILEFQRARLGAGDSQTLDTQFKLAATLRAMRQHEAAYELMKDGLELRRKVGDKRTTATSLVAIAGLETDMENYEAAISRLVEALELHEAVDDRELGSIAALLGLAQTLRKSGDCAGAVAPREKARKIMTKALGANHTFTMIASSEAGECALSENRFDEAASFFEAALGPMNQPHTQETYAAVGFGLAQALWQLPARRSEARGHAETALDVFSKQPFANPDDIAQVKAWLRKHYETR